MVAWGSHNALGVIARSRKVKRCLSPLKLLLPWCMTKLRVAYRRRRFDASVFGLPWRMRTIRGHDRTGAVPPTCFRGGWGGRGGGFALAGKELREECHRYAHHKNGNSLRWKRKSDNNSKAYSFILLNEFFIFSLVSRLLSIEKPSKMTSF
jgi:hypothetical protein